MISEYDRRELDRLSNPLFHKAFSGQNVRSVALVAGVLSLVACAALHPPTPPAPAEGFVLQGRLAIRTATEGLSSNFLWEHSPERFAIELWGPLGQGRSRLEGDRERVTLTAADGARYEERDLGSAVHRWLGVDLPVAALTFWVLGEPAPGPPPRRLERNPAGDLVRLEQLDWSLEFAQYALEGQRRVPGRIVASRAEVKVTLLARSWSFAAVGALAARPLEDGTP
jgi:outer membrane lipoprotein LolB